MAMLNNQMVHGRYLQFLSVPDMALVGVLAASHTMECSSYKLRPSWQCFLIEKKNSRCIYHRPLKKHHDLTQTQKKKLLLYLL